MIFFYLQIPFLHLYINADFLGGVPHEFHAIIGRGRLTNVYHPITKGNIDLEQSFTGSCALPCEHLFPFSVLKSPLVEANAYCRLKQKRWMSLQRRCSTVWVTHIFRTSRTFMSSFGLLRVKNKGDVLIIRQWYIGDTMMIIMIIIGKFCLYITWFLSSTTDKKSSQPSYCNQYELVWFRFEKLIRFLRCCYPNIDDLLIYFREPVMSDQVPSKSSRDMPTDRPISSIWSRTIDPDSGRWASLRWLSSQCSWQPQARIGNYKKRYSPVSQ